MQSKKSFFNKTLFVKNLTRYWPLWAIYLAIWIIAMPVQIWDELRIFGGSGSYYPEDVLDIASGVGLVTSSIGAAFAAMAVWSYLYNSRSAGQFASLPISRAGLFVTNVASVLGAMLGVNALIFVLSLLVQIVGGGVNVIFLLKAFAIVSMQNIFFFGFATFCAMLTGHILALPALYAALNFVVISLAGLANAILGKLVYGFSEWYPLPVEILTPCLGIAENCQNTYNYDPVAGSRIYTGFEGWGCLIGYCIAGIVLLLLAYALYKRRRMESAGDVVAVKPLKPVFRVVMSVCGSLAIGVLLYSTTNSYHPGTGGMGTALTLLLFLTIGAFVGWFAAEMLLQKALLVFGNKKSWLGLLVVVLLVSAGLVTAELDVTGFERRLPESGTVKEVSFGGLTGLNSSDPALIDEVIRLHSQIIDGKEESGGYSRSYVQIEYVREDGSVLRREYSLLTDYEKPTAEQPEPLRTVYATINSPAFVDAALSDLLKREGTLIGEVGIGNYRKTLTSVEMSELFYDCIYPDMLDGNLDYATLSSTGDLDYLLHCNISVDMSIGSGEKARYFYHSFNPSIYSRRTIAWLESQDWFIESGRELLTHNEYTQKEMASYKASDSDLIAPMTVYYD